MSSHIIHSSDWAVDTINSVVYSPQHPLNIIFPFLYSLPNTENNS